MNVSQRKINVSTWKSFFCFRNPQLPQCPDWGVPSARWARKKVFETLLETVLLDVYKYLEMGKYNMLMNDPKTYIYTI